MPNMEIDLKISEDSLDCILEMAGYGMAYWASSATVLKEAREYRVIESEEGEYEEHVVSFDKIEEAFWKIANPGSGVGSIMVKQYAFNAIKDGLQNGEGDIDAGHVDADLADAIIQIAIFGEITFG